MDANNESQRRNWGGILIWERKLEMRIDIVLGKMDNWKGRMNEHGNPKRGGWKGLGAFCLGS